MTEKDFWRKSTVAVIGGGSWGTVLAHLLSGNCSEVRIWTRDDEDARAFNATRNNPRYAQGLHFGGNVRALSDPDRVFEGGVQAVIWALPSKALRQSAREFSRHFQGDEMVIHATKGIEEGTLKRMTEVLREELPAPRIGVISGPNLADEVARGEPAATVVASAYLEVIEAGRTLLTTERFRVYGNTDVVGVEWAGVLKNVLAIAAGSLDALGLGANARSALISRGLAEMVRFSEYFGARQETFLGLAGVGDLLATCSSSLSRNYRVGQALASGKTLEQALDELGSTAEGVQTCMNVWKFAEKRGIYMPITEGVYRVIQGQCSAREALHQLMTRASNQALFEA